VETVRVYDLLQRRVLVTRESAHAIQTELTSSLTNGGREIVLDFSNVDAVTPSFVDEVLAIIDEAVSRTPRSTLNVKFVHAPTRLSEKFAAIGRSHGAQITESSPGAWTIRRELPAAND
jgi:hypothetical protein